MLEGLSPEQQARLDAIRARPDAERGRPHRAPTAPPPTTLSRRHLQVLELIAEGLPDVQIGAELGVSRNTIKTHVKTILSRLEANSRTHAVAIGFRRGLLV